MELCININTHSGFQFNGEMVIPDGYLLDPASHQCFIEFCQVCSLLVSEAIIVRRTSPLASIVLMDSFSKNTGMFFSFNCLMYFKQSKVFLANRLIDFVIIMSIVPASQSLIMRLNSSLFFVLVPEIPSSAYIPANSHSGFFLIYSV